jgi:hypothetical protein
MIGISSPSTMICALSTPIPKSAAKMCSTVFTSAVEEPSVVQRTVERTMSGVAAMREPSAKTNEKPAFAGAGAIVTLVLHPVCRPTPESETSLAMVC